MALKTCLLYTSRIGGHLSWIWSISGQSDFEAISDILDSDICFNKNSCMTHFAWPKPLAFIAWIELSYLACHWFEVLSIFVYKRDFHNKLFPAIYNLLKFTIIVSIFVLHFTVLLVTGCQVHVRRSCLEPGMWLSETQICHC